VHPLDKQPVLDLIESTDMTDHTRIKPPIMDGIMYDKSQESYGFRTRNIEDDLINDALTTIQNDY
jgi:hypothetical protein